MRNRRQYLGIGFEVWDDFDMSGNKQAWFWLVIDSHRGGGVIGSAVSEADAVREACASIEEHSSHRQSDLAAVRNSITRAGWKASLANLDRYLALNGAPA